MQTGGIIKKNDNVASIISIMNMINIERAKIKKISFESLYGFVFELQVPDIKDCETEFFGLNESKSGFTRPIDAVVIKISVLNKGEYELPELILNNELIQKLTSIEEEFKKEAVLQSEIYHQTLSRGDPICPSIIDLLILSSNDATAFLDKMKSKSNEIDDSRLVIEWLINCFSEYKKCNLGMIVMESAMSYNSFFKEQTLLYNSIKKSATRGRSAKSSLSSKAMTSEEIAGRHKNMLFTLLQKVIRLYNECRIVHFDLHKGNSMVKYNESDKNYNLYLIDFGRAGSVRTGFRIAKEFIGIDKNKGFISTFSPSDIEHILNKIIEYEKKWRNHNIGGDVSVIEMDYVDIISKYFRPSKKIYEELADALNLFYSKGLFKYKQLSNKTNYYVSSKNIDFSREYSKCYSGAWTRKRSLRRGDRWVNKESSLSIPLSDKTAAPVTGGKVKNKRKNRTTVKGAFSKIKSS